MSDAHAILQTAWETGDTLPLLVLADYLEERGDQATPHLIRLTVAEATTSRHSAVRTRQLKQLRESAWSRIRESGWPDMGVQPDASFTCFSRRVEPHSRDSILVRCQQKTLHWVRSAYELPDEVIRSRDGALLLRRTLPPPMVDIFSSGRDPWGASLGFSLEHDYFPLPANWQTNPEQHLAARQRRIEAALRPAEIRMVDLPQSLVPFVAWVLTDHVTSRVHRARSGMLVTGAHLFSFSIAVGEWRHSAAIESHDSGKAATLARRRLRWGRDRGVVATLLVRVADSGKITARKLVWQADGEHETDNLSGATSSLAGAHFLRAAGDLNLGNELAGRFVLDTSAKLHALFLSQGAPHGTAALRLS